MSGGGGSFRSCRGGGPSGHVGGGDPSGHGAVAQTLGLCMTSEIEMSCFIVSKATLKSTGIRVVPCLLSVDVLLALVTYSSAVSVRNFFFRFAD